jgi:hypothetical protein
MPVSLPRLQQSQVAAAVNRSRAQAIKVTTAEAITANDIIVATSCSATGLMTVSKASPTDIAKCRGPFFVADYSAASGVTTDLAIPWKVITGVNTSAVADQGGAVWLAASGGYTVGPPPAAVTDVGSKIAFSLAVKVGQVLVDDSGTGGRLLLDPGIANGAPLVGRVTRGGSSAAVMTVTGFTTDLNGAPVVATSSATQHVLSALIGSQELVITASANTTSTYTYMILA